MGENRAERRRRAKLLEKLGMIELVQPADPERDRAESDRDFRELMQRIAAIAQGRNLSGTESALIQSLANVQVVMARDERHLGERLMQRSAMLAECAVLTFREMRERRG